MEKISAVYKIVNEITGDFYVGSSKDIKKRWVSHRSPSRWEKYPNSPLYQDMQKYGVDKFSFQIIASVEPECLKQVEQEFIEKLQPTYNDRRSKGLDVERYKENKKIYAQTDNGKEVAKKSRKRYRQTDKSKEYQREYQKKYFSQLCSYNGETLRLGALAMRFRRAGIKHYVPEAKKYLIET